MTAGAGFRIDGLEAARAAAEKALRGAGAGAQASLELVGQQGAAEVARRAPVLTGTLSRSYTWAVGSGYVEIGTNVVYAPAQEFGSRGSAGRPHVRPGIEALTPKIASLVAEGASRSMGGGGLGSVGAALRGGL